MNIVLCGMPGSGKTTLAAEFKRRNMPVVDTDEQIVKKYGSISDIFTRYGEERFREIESEIVRELSALDGAVIATGGGCVLRDINVQIFRQSGKIFYLKTNLDTLLQRVGNGATRPLLAGDVKGNLTKLYGERAPIYERAADVIIQTDGLTPAQIADLITVNV